MVKSRNLDFDTVKKHARVLRANMTDSEMLLWNELRNRKLEGYKFLRQHPIIYKGDLKRLYYFVADFYCNEKKLVIELDGEIHNDSVEYDSFRDSELNSLGIQTLRIKNEELKNMEEIRQKILSIINTIN